MWNVLARSLHGWGNHSRKCTATNSGLAQSSAQHQRGAGFEPLEERALLAVAPLSDAFVVNSFTAGDQQTAGNQSVAMDAAGNFVVVWQSNGQDGDGWGVYGQRFDAEGQRHGEEFLVNTTTVGDQTSPAVAMNASGQFVVAWSSGQPAAPGVYFRQFTAGGSPRDAERQALVELGGGIPGIDIDQAGNFVVQATGDFRGMLQVFDASGAPRSPAFPGLLVGEPTQGVVAFVNDRTITSVMNSDGTVSIYGYGSTPPHPDNPPPFTRAVGVWMQRSSSGDVLSWPVPIVLDAHGGYGAPLTALNGLGDTVTKWPSLGLLVTSLSTRVTAPAYEALALDDRGESIGVWVDSGVRFQTVDRFGAITSEGSASTGSALQPSVAVTGEVAIVAWTNGREVLGRRYAANSDSTPPTIARVEGIREDGVLVNSSLVLMVSEALSTEGGTTGDFSVTNSSNWRLLRDGADASGDLRSVHYEFVPSLGQHRVTVTFASQLPSGNYELRVRGTVRDLAGNQLAGDGQAAGTDFLASFIRPAKTHIAGVSVEANAITAIGDTLGLTVWSAGGSLWGQVFSPEFATAVESPVKLAITSDAPHLDLNTGELLMIRDDDGVADSPPQNWLTARPPIPVSVQDHFTMAGEGVLQLYFDSDQWGSTILFESGIPVSLGGTLKLTFADDADAAVQVGQKLDLFDWSGVSPTGAFNVASSYLWDLSHLYTTGDITLMAVNLIPGDANGDGTVDTTDFGILKDHFGGAGSWADGDSNGDGKIDLGDFGLLKTNFGRGGAAVPEPASWLLALMAALGCVASLRSTSSCLVIFGLRATRAGIGPALGLWLGLLCPVRLHAAEFLKLPTGPAVVHDISYDGKTLVRDLFGTPSWAANLTTMERLGWNWENRFGTSSGSALAVSPDGKVIVGSAAGPSVDPLYSSAQYPAVGPGHFPSFQFGRGAAVAASNEGAVIIGNADRGQRSEIFRWTARRTQWLGSEYSAVDVSGDGSVVLGDRAIWTEAIGWTDLGSLPGEGASTAARSLSENGRVAVGTSRGRAFWWTVTTGMVDLGVVPGEGEINVTSVSGDGTLVVGIRGARLFLWDQFRGARDLQQAFVDEQGLGAELASWTSLTALGSKPVVSGDGSTIAGDGSFPDFPGFSVWVAKLDPPLPVMPGDANSDGTVDLADFGTLKANFGSGHFHYEGDFSGDYRVNLTDFGLLEANLGKGVAAVPEPATVTLAVLGLTLVLLTRRPLLGCPAISRSPRLPVRFPAAVRYRGWRAWALARPAIRG